MAGAKDDRRDALVLADSLRTDQPSFSRLRLDDPQCMMLRETESGRRNAARRLPADRESVAGGVASLLSSDAPVGAQRPMRRGSGTSIYLVPTPAHAAEVSEEQVSSGAQGHVGPTSHRIRRVKAARGAGLLADRCVAGGSRGCRSRAGPLSTLTAMSAGIGRAAPGVAQRVQALLTTLAEEPSEAGGPSDVRMVQSLPGVGRKMTGVGFSAGRASIATKMRYAFGIPRQGFQRRHIPDAMPQRQHTS